MHKHFSICVYASIFITHTHTHTHTHSQVWILAEVWGGTNNPDQDVHGGVALLTCCITTFLSGVLVRVGTIGQEPGLGM
jgi:hypothetical protein